MPREDTDSLYNKQGLSALEKITRETILENELANVQTNLLTQNDDLNPP